VSACGVGVVGIGVLVGVGVRGRTVGSAVGIAWVVGDNSKGAAAEGKVRSDGVCCAPQPTLPSMISNMNKQKS
jgi:hypothetical protein